MRDFIYRRRMVGAACAVALAGAVAGGGTAVHAAGPPTVTAVSPTGSSTEGGIAVVITGTAFTGATSVQFGSAVVKLTPCPIPVPTPPPPSGCFTVTSDTQISAINPGHVQTTVPLDVQVTTPGGVSALNAGDHFSYTAPVPKPTLLTVHSGTGGMLVKVAPASGGAETSGFDFATSVNFVPASGPTITVTQSPCPLGTVFPDLATSGCFTIVADQIDMRVPSVPAGAIGTPYDVTVTTAGGTSPVNAAGDQFTFLRVFDTLDAAGGLHAVTGTTPAPAGVSYGFNIARGFAPMPGTANAGYVLDGFGGINSVGGAPVVHGTGYWQGWDIARGIALRADGTSGYVVDGFGGIHAFGGAPAPVGGTYFGFDIARGIVLGTNGTSGYTLDGYGGVHPWGGAPALPGGGYWLGHDIYRSLVLRADKLGGYTLDGWGGIHPVGDAPGVGGGAYFPGFDIARAIVLLPDPASSGASPGGYVLDGWGALHEFGSAARAVTSYYPGRDVVRAVGVL